MYMYTYVTKGSMLPPGIPASELRPSPHEATPPPPRYYYYYYHYHYYY